MAARTFDRTHDMAKLVGCNTRNVEYRWTIFERHLRTIPKNAEVLDFGAGSLRESFELSERNFLVTAVDRDEETLAGYLSDYDWKRRPEILVGSDLSALLERRFGLITAFDVFEHLEDPGTLVSQMRSVLAPGGLIFCTVPNRRSIYEIAFRLNWKLGLAMGRSFTPGEPHIQFKSPREWRSFFESCGLRIVEHDMAIGFFVNTWAAMVDVPVRAFGKVKRALGGQYDPTAVRTLSGPRVMRALDALDRRTQFRSLYGWNLFVLAQH